jgi:hypothetical protein
MEIVVVELEGSGDVPVVFRGAVGGKGGGDKVDEGADPEEFGRMRVCPG